MLMFHAVFISCWAVIQFSQLIDNWWVIVLITTLWLIRSLNYHVMALILSRCKFLSRICKTTRCRVYTKCSCNSASHWRLLIKFAKLNSFVHLRFSALMQCFEGSQNVVNCGLRHKIILINHCFADWMSCCVFSLWLLVNQRDRGWLNMPFFFNSLFINVLLLQVGRKKTSLVWVALQGDELSIARNALVYIRHIFFGVTHRQNRLETTWLVKL